MISIIVALESEAKHFVSQIENKKESILAGKKVYIGSVCGKEISLIISGIGKVNASLSTQLMIDKFSPEFVINFGTAGGLTNAVKVGDFYKINKCAQYDFDLSELDPVPVGYIQDYDTVFFNNYTGVTCFPNATLGTGDRFSDNVKDYSTLINMGCEVKDMEGAAISQVCTANKINNNCIGL